MYVTFVPEADVYTDILNDARSPGVKVDGTMAYEPADRAVALRNTPQMESL